MEEVEAQRHCRSIQYNRSRDEVQNWVGDENQKKSEERVDPGEMTPGVSVNRPMQVQEATLTKLERAPETWADSLWDSTRRGRRWVDNQS